MTSLTCDVTNKPAQYNNQTVFTSKMFAATFSSEDFTFYSFDGLLGVSPYQTKQEADYVNNFMYIQRSVNKAIDNEVVMFDPGNMKVRIGSWDPLALEPNTKLNVIGSMNNLTSPTYFYL